jgi:hypothetical protein
VGFGLNEQVVGGIQVWMKGGSAPKHHAVLVLVPDRKAGIFIAINRQEPLFTQQFLAEFLTTFYGPPGRPVTPTPEPSDAGAFVGHYQLNRANFSGIESIAAPLLQVQVTSDGEGLRLRALISGWTDTALFAPAGENVFRTDRQYVAFRPQDGMMFTNVDGDHISLRRLAWWQRADVLGFCGALALLTMLTFPLTRLASFVSARLQRRTRVFVAPAQAGHALAASAALLLGVGVICLAQANLLVFGPTPALYGLSGSALLFIATTLWACRRLIKEWRGPPAPASRAHAVLSLVAAMLISLMLLYFNVPYFRF